MKREFLQNFKVGDTELPKEVIDAIMDENGRDIEAAKSKYGDYDTIKTQLAEAQKTIQGFQSQDIDAIKASAHDWEEKYKKAIADHEAEKAETAFQNILKDAIAAAKGRNAKAISALLDLDALRQSKNQDGDIKAALEAVRKENDYLFGDDKPPKFSASTGGHSFGGTDPETLAIRAAAGLNMKGD